MCIKCFSDIGTDTGSGTKQLAGQDGFSFDVFYFIAHFDNG